MHRTGLLVSLLATVSARREAGAPAPPDHELQRRSGGFSPIIPDFHGHHHGNGYPVVGPGPGPGYPGPVYPHPPPYPGPDYHGGGPGPYPGHHGGGGYLPPVPHTSVYIEPEKIVLNCVVQGYAATPIQWLKTDGPGLVAEGGAVLWDRRHLLVETDVYGGGRRSRLVLSHPRPRHLGVYRCQADGAASQAFSVGGGDGGFQPVYHGRSAGSGQILAAREPGAETGAEPPPLPEDGGRSEPLTAPKEEEENREVDEEEKREIIETIKREIEDVENAVRSARRF